MNKISLKTSGCRLNQSETAVLERSFEENGYCLVDGNQPADIAVINTCTVTKEGDNDTRRLINKILRINPATRIVLIGCQAETQKEDLLKLPNVQLVVGNARKMDLAKILKEAKKNAAPQIITPPIPKKSFTVPTAGRDRRHTRANLKVQDGCDFFCSFCEVPYARGRARSREFRDILTEANRLTQAGHKELVLTGINVGMYSYKNRTLLDVVDALEMISGIRRLRISSIEHTTIPAGLAEKMEGPSKLCRYFHIPLQSGSDKILKLMNRKYHADDYRKAINKIKEFNRDICVGTDVVIGFPGETDEDFQYTQSLLEELPISYFHVFSYSERLLAKSKNLPGKVKISTVQKRSKILRELSVQKRQAFLKSALGKTQCALFEQKKGGYWSGLTDNYIQVKVKSDKNLNNQFVPVSLESLDQQAIKGRLA